MTSFDRVAVVDWSAASTLSPARPSPDAIWIGLCGPEGAAEYYHRSRDSAEAALRALIAQPGRWLIGFDFPMGYPQGFAARLTGHSGAPAIWHWLADRITDAPDNRNNRFTVAAAINRQFGAGPFWGRPAALALPDLPARKTVNYPALGLTERRLIEQRVPRAQPVWKLYTTGSVGSQALMGLPRIARLAALPGVSVWPFQPPARVVLAEVYPSLLDPLVRAAPGIKDAAQVRLLARALWRLAQAGRLAPLLADVPPEAQAEEGWILGAGHGALLCEAAA
ncbi:molybdopterin-guanine dinucleotide biosynthesis protein B [Gemmobacter aquatilis]|uniref:Molybdopterin-guanine dinucleotide biosynthesis protein B n=1 Tax=Gemmobacter aquatilis TaxID=933059 RepID=A0A1H7ZDD6_9RHOB|nr:hypothetical protein [Gemmobacter aquatilis]SEM56326.1 molybdopterin-guanine dinucleotide biosynthesis protein B [Gemmobacter aquatilis]